MTDNPDEVLERAVETGGNALADAHGWHADRGDYHMARIVITAARSEIEAPLRDEIANLRAEVERLKETAVRSDSWTKAIDAAAARTRKEPS